MSKQLIPFLSTIFLRICSRLLVISAIVGITNIARAEELPTLERALLQEAPKILEFVSSRGYKNIGVLKFRIREGDGQPSDRTGLLNRNLADRLELALIIKNRLQSPIGIIHDASQVAASLSGATHLTHEGRTKLFETTYPLAWGNTKVSADAFLVGAVQIDSDYKNVVIGVSAFGKADEKMIDVVKFSARLTTNELIEIGGSFSTRSVFGGGNLQMTSEQRETKAIDAASLQVASVKSKQSRHPLNDPTSPVQLTVRYDGQQIPIEFRDGGAFLKEPHESQKVSLVLQRTSAADKTRYAAVLRVNGENTLYRQRLKDLDCSKWILEPGEPAINVEGFQLNDQQKQQFKVLSKLASQGKEMDYGSDVGTISLVVFQQKTASTPRPPSLNLLADDAEDFAILSRGTFPSEFPESLDALKSQLALSSANRGLITEGQTVAGAIRRATFEADPVPLLVATITYYRK